MLTRTFPPRAIMPVLPSRLQFGSYGPKINAGKQYVKSTPTRVVQHVLLQMLTEIKGESWYTTDKPGDERWSDWVHRRLPVLYKMIPKVGS
jgi:hypothetical protein